MLDNIMVTIIGIFLIIFIYWFFLMRKVKKITVKDSIDIIVNGGYSPEVILIENNKTTILNFIRNDPSSCLEEVVLPDFKIRKFLPLDQKISIEIHPEKTGEFTYSCGMNMFHGKIIVQ